MPVPINIKKRIQLLIDLSRLFTILLLLTLSLSVFANKIYSWHDEHGVLIFSDTPRLGAKEIEIQQANVIEFPVNISNVEKKPQLITQSYKVKINQPKANSSIRSNKGLVNITVQVQPVFEPAFTLQLYVDNKPYKKPQTNTTFALHNVDRGEHQIKIILRSDKGKIIATSSNITFYMHRSLVNRSN